MKLNVTCACSDPFSFENVLEKINQINKTIYGVDTLTEKEELVVEECAGDSEQCETCGKVSCMCYEEKLERNY